MQESNGRRTNPLRQLLQSSPTRGLQIQRHHHQAIGSQSLIHFHDGTVQRLRLADCEREKVGTLLVADGEKIGESTRYEQSGRSTPPFEKSIRAPRRGKTHGDRRQGSSQGRFSHQMGSQDRRLFANDDLERNPDAKTPDIALQFDLTGRSAMASDAGQLTIRTEEP
jgi:hypothetical protein